MKLNLDPAVTAPRHITAESEALAEWYDAHPTVRRLWAIRDGEGEAWALSVILTLEPTMDNGDTSPSWLACSTAWAREIQSLTNRPVRMGLLDEPAAREFEIDVEGEIVAALSWRDPTYYWQAD
jgi:hypothetical protein